MTPSPPASADAASGPSANQLTDKAFIAISFGSVVAAIITGFWMLGSPGKQRLLSLDSERVQNLSSIASELANEVRPPGEVGEAQPLPETLPPWLEELYRDPVTNEPYEYRKLSEESYELCATFALASVRDPQRATYDRGFSTLWEHPEGRHCFEIEKLDTRPKQ